MSKKKKVNFMVDIETLGVAHDAALLSIGAVEFGMEGVTREFYKVIDMDSSIKSGGTITPSTLKWWLKQGEASLFSMEGEPHREVMAGFALWLLENTNPRDVIMWANAPSFDCSILESAFVREGIRTPWRFWNERDHRTLKNLWKVKYKASGIKHNALDDARLLKEFYELIKKS